MLFQSPQKNVWPCTSVFFLLKVAAVEGFINSVESRMRQRQEQQKLATISARIDSYEAVEGSSEEVEKVRNNLWEHQIFFHVSFGKKSPVRYETLCKMSYIKYPFPAFQ